MVIVRCDGGAAIGMGHVSRCLALADELRDAHASAVLFAMRDSGSNGVAAVRSSGYEVIPLEEPADADYGARLLALTTSRTAGVLVVDVRDRLSRASLDAVRASGVRVAGIDDGTERRLATDLVFYPPVPQVDEMDWSEYAGRRFAGWGWVLLRREFAADDRGAGRPSPSLPRQASHPIDILVTMGGSDPAGMTEFALEALNLLPEPQAVEVVIGPAFSRAPAVTALAGHSKHAVRVSRSPDAMAPLMRASRVAVSAFGISAYELAACGVPAVHLCLTADHARSSSAFDTARIAQTLGVFGDVRPGHLATAVDRLLRDAGVRSEMSARAHELVDGRGAARVAALVVAGLS